jgi:hypothetical protein
MSPESEFLVRVVLDDGGAVDAWWYRREDRELKEIGSNGRVLLRSWCLGFIWIVLLSSSEDMMLSQIFVAI